MAWAAAVVVIAGAVAGWLAASAPGVTMWVGVGVSTVVGAMWALAHRRSISCTTSLAVMFWISIFGWLTLLVLSIGPINAWISEAPVPYAFAAVATVKYVSVIGALWVCAGAGLSRRALMIRTGNAAASSGLRAGPINVRWYVLGPLIMSVVLALFMTAVSPGATRWDALMRYSLIILTGCVLNAVAEELLYRHTLITALRRVTTGRTAVLYSSLVFGIGHLNGNPGGLVGLAFTAVFGAMCAWAVLTTRGMVWNVPIHIIGDIGVQYTLL